MRCIRRSTASRHALLIAATAAVLVLLAGCGAATVSLAALAERQGAFAGKDVHVHGKVRRERERGGRTYFVLTDTGGDLVGLKPAARARPYAGRQVEVSGRFEVEAGFGRVIHVAKIAPR